MNIITALKLPDSPPWLPMSEIVKLTGRNAVELRAEAKDFIAKGLIQKVGKKRATRYGLPDAEVPESTISDDMDFKQEIRRVMEEKKGRVSRKDLCEAIGTYDGKIRPHLMKMVESGEISHNNKKKRQLFWLTCHEEEGIVYNAPEETVSLPGEEPEVVERPKVKDIESLIRMGLGSLPTGENSALLVNELKNHIYSCANHDFSLAEIFDAFHNLLSEEKLPRVRYERRNHHGNRLFFWVEDPVKETIALTEDDIRALKSA